MKGMTINKWPKQERPREKLLDAGVKTLSDAELIAVLIGSGTKGRSAVAVARELLGAFGSIRAVSEAQRDDLCSHSGIGETCYSRLQVANELSRRSLLETLKKGDILVNADKARSFLSLQMRHYEKEVFACLFLDNQHQVIAFEELFHGTIDNASVHPREIMKRVLYHNSSAVIFAHNHPSGSPEPSVADQHLTDELKQTLSSIDVRVLDHFIIGDTVTSFAERNLL